MLLKNGKVVIPGKLMGEWNILQKSNCFCLQFYQICIEKIEGAGGKCMIYNEFIKKNPTGKDVW